jgi:hypothetical protein
LEQITPYGMLMMMAERAVYRALMRNSMIHIRVRRISPRKCSVSAESLEFHLRTRCVHTLADSRWRRAYIHPQHAMGSIYHDLGDSTYHILRNTVLCYITSPLVWHRLDDQIRLTGH